MSKKRNIPQKDWSSKSNWRHPDDVKKKKAALEIPESLGINLSPELKEDFSSAIDYFIYSSNVLDSPRKSDTRKALEELYEISEKFISVLSNFENPNLNKALWEHEYSKSLLFQPKNENLRNDALRIAKVYNDAAFFALQDFPKDKGGPSPNYPLNTFTNRLAAIYKAATGKKARITYDPYLEGYSGHFYSLVNDCLNALRRPYYSPNSLGKFIQRALKSRE